MNCISFLTTDLTKESNKFLAFQEVHSMSSESERE